MITASLKKRLSALETKSAQEHGRVTRIIRLFVDHDGNVVEKITHRIGKKCS